MTIKNLEDLRKMTDAELRKYAAEAREEARDIRFKVHVLEHKNPNDLKNLRKVAAQALTILGEREIAGTPVVEAA